MKIEPHSLTPEGSASEFERLRRLTEKDKEKFLASLPEDKREELKRLAETDIPRFLRDRDKRLLKFFKAGRRHRRENTGKP